LRITYTAKGTKGWAGIYWQNPANNWGISKGGFDLTGAKVLNLLGQGQRWRRKNFRSLKVGGLSGTYPDSDVAWLGPVKLKNEWKQYKINLEGKDLKFHKRRFLLSPPCGDNPAGCTFYIDEMRFE